MIQLTGENIAAAGFGLTVLSTVFYAARKVGKIESAITTLTEAQKTHGDEMAKNTQATTDLSVSLVEVRTVLMGTPLAPNGIRGDVAELKKEIGQVRDLKHEVRNLLQVHTPKD